MDDWMQIQWHLTDVHIREVSSHSRNFPLLPLLHNDFIQESHKGKSLLNHILGLLHKESVWFV